MAIRMLNEYNTDAYSTILKCTYNHTVRVYMADYLHEAEVKIEEEYEKGRNVYKPPQLSNFVEEDTGELYQAYVFISYEYHGDVSTTK